LAGIGPPGLPKSAACVGTVHSSAVTRTPAGMAGAWSALRSAALGLKMR
jgi:hypothetical protein